jgi:dihydroorotate dehydrogenase
LRDLLARLTDARAAATARPPRLLKVSPDLAAGEREAIAELALAFALDGLIVGNTTTTRPDGLRSRHRQESGGLSGAPLMAPSTAALAGFASRAGWC